MRPSVPVTNRSRWLGLRAIAVIGERSAAAPPETLNQLAQPLRSSERVEGMGSSVPVTNRSRCSGLRATAVIGEPSAAAPPETLNQLAQPLLASHHVE